MPIKLPVPAAPRVVSARPLDAVPVLRGDAVQQAARQADAGLPDAAATTSACRPRRASSSLVDAGSFHERDAGLQSVDPLGFVDQKPYPDRVAARRWPRACATRRSGARRGSAARRVAIVVMDFGFMGGSMGAVVGEKVTRAAEDALAERMPLIIVSASGGARMQEGTLALMQLAKTVAAIERLRAAACRSSRSSPTPRPAACSRPSRPSATSTWRSRTRSSGSPGRGCPRAPSRRSCRRASSAPSSCSSTDSSTASSTRRAPRRGHRAARVPAALGARRR